MDTDASVLRTLDGDRLHGSARGVLEWIALVEGEFSERLAVDRSQLHGVNERRVIDDLEAAGVSVTTASYRR